MSVSIPPAAGFQLDSAGNGTFAVYSPRASALWLCIFNDSGETRIPLTRFDQGFWWDYVEGIVPGTNYGIRADGPWDPAAGDLFNPEMLLLDPYGRAVSGVAELGANMYPMPVDALLNATTMDVPDLSPRYPELFSVYVPRVSQVDHRPRVEWRDTVVYELHVRGFTKLAQFLPAELRGTYAGLAHPRTQEYLRNLGVTTLELLPVHAMLDEPHLARMGAHNYWGYSTLSYFSPNPRYATVEAQKAGAAAVVAEFREMVRSLHEGGFEVVLDVVYNHTCEGGLEGPSLCWKGLGAGQYYWLDNGHFQDFTGTGNTLNVRSSAVNRMIIDSLRYWAEEFQIDGFRFDLAATLGRTGNGFTRDHPLLFAMTSDPLLRECKLIAEPWDVGWDGWQTGNFLPGFAEWNDAFRGNIRSFWLTDQSNRLHHPDWVGAGVRDLATRLSGSADIFTRRESVNTPSGRSVRAPWASVNFITAHDGFTMHDLCAYNSKHNELNGEDNRDGSSDNRSFNHGHEGEVPVDDERAEGINAARLRTQRNLLATLLLSAGTPMLTAGDEVSRSQGGNNNAYCQDNEVSWLNWEFSSAAQSHWLAVSRLIALRKRFAQLHPFRFLHALSPEQLHAPGDNGGVVWCLNNGEVLNHEDWTNPRLSTLQVLRPGTEADILLVFHAGLEGTEITAPRFGGSWRFAELLWTSDSPDGRADLATPGIESIFVPGNTVSVFRVFHDTNNAG